MACGSGVEPAFRAQHQHIRECSWRWSCCRHRPPGRKPGTHRGEELGMLLRWCSNIWSNEGWFWNADADNSINLLNILVFSYTHLWHTPGSWDMPKFLTLLPPFASLSEGLPRSFAVCLQSWGRMTFPEPVAVNVLRSSWQEVPEAGMLFLLHSHWAHPPKALLILLAPGLGRHSSKARDPCGRARAGRGRRRMHKEEEVTLHHCKRFEFRKKKILHSIQYRIYLKNASVPCLTGFCCRCISICTSHIIYSTLSIFIDLILQKKPVS